MVYLWGYTLKASRKPISEFVKRVYLGYFGVKLGDQEKPWAPHIVCKNLYGAFAPVGKWKEKLPEIWSTNGLEGTEKPLQ
jgi:hypothetical protein